MQVELTFFLWIWTNNNRIAFVAMKEMIELSLKWIYFYT